MKHRIEHIGDHTLYLGDCLTIMAELGPVDAVVTDPPYADRSMKNARSGKNIKHRRDGQIHEFGYAALEDEIRIASALEFSRLASRWVLVWCDIESIHLWKADLVGKGLRYVRTGIWVRSNGAPQFSGDRLGQGVEACVIAHNQEARLRWNGGGSPAVWLGPIVNSRSSERMHSSPKPQWLMDAQIEDFTDRGETILDPFMGSGTTGVACAKLGRKFIGIEIEEKYFDIACRRIEQAASQIRMEFDVPKPMQEKMGL